MTQKQCITSAKRRKQQQRHTTFITTLAIITIALWVSSVWTVAWIYVIYPDNKKQNHHHQPEKASSSSCQGIYSELRSDRSGSIIRNMLQYHYHAYRKNTTYCGACGVSEHLDTSQRLVETLGLTDELPFLGHNCPPEVKFATKKKGFDNGRTNTPRFAAWRKHIQRKVQQHVATTAATLNKSGTNHNTIRRHRVVVHVRRGDLDPSTAERDYEISKYLSNDYFLELIEQHKRPDSQVIVFTEPAYAFGGGSSTTNQASSETNDVFYQRNYTVVIGGDEEVAWRAFLDCDVLIGSKSSFSQVPAMFTRAKVFFPENFYPVMPDWVLVEAPPTAPR